MITKGEISKLWLEACPSFRAAFAKSCAGGNEELLYIHAGAFAHHLLALHRANQRDEFAAVGAFIECLHVEGDDYVREFATIGILEDVQNVWGHTDVSPDEFIPFLPPVSARAWNSLNQFWKGAIPFVPDPRPAKSS